MANMGPLNNAFYNIISGQAFTVAKKAINWLKAPSLAGVRLEVESYEEVLESKVSEQMLMNINGEDMGKAIVTDNIAPIPRTWNISGYIGSALVISDLSKYVNADTKALLSKIASVGIPIPTLEPYLAFMPSLNLQRNVLREAWENYKLIWFVSKDKEYIPVAIKSLRFRTDPAIQNKIPFTLTIKEVKTFWGYSSGGKKVATTQGSTWFNDKSSGTVEPNVNNPASSWVNSGSVSATKV